MARLAVHTLAILTFIALSSASSVPREALSPELTPILRVVRQNPRTVVNGGIRPRDLDDTRVRRDAPPFIFALKTTRLTRGIPSRYAFGGIRSRDLDDTRVRRDAPPFIFAPKTTRLTRGIPSRYAFGGIRVRDLEDARVRRDAPPTRIVLSQTSRFTRGIPPRLIGTGIGGSRQVEPQPIRVARGLPIRPNGGLAG